MSYDPQNGTDRIILAQAILDLMVRSVFVEVFRPGTKERVFSREVPGTDGRVNVLIYTSIEGNQVRECGTDAIRVCAVYSAKDGKERGIASAEKRVHRVGQIGAITDRLIERMREVWKATKTAEKCHCGAPKFTAKSGKLCCADICWKRQEATSRPSSYRAPWGAAQASAACRSSIPANATMPASWSQAPLAKQVAFAMAAGDTSGFDWDRWADERKENGY